MATLSAEQAQALLQRGDLTQDTYDRYFGNPPAEPPAPSPMAPSEELPPPVPFQNAQNPEPQPQAPEPAPVDPDEARKARQRQTFADHKAGVEKLERQTEAKRLEDDQRAIDEKISRARKFGVPEEQINAALVSDRQDLAKQQEAQLVKTGGLGDPGATDKPPVVLASDGARYGESAPSQTTATVSALDKLLAGSTAGLDAMAAGVQLAAKTGEAKAAEQAAYLAKTAQDDENRVKSSEAGEAIRQDKLDARLKELDAEAARLGSMKVDPKRLWKNAATGDKILAGIGMVLGAFGSGASNRGVAVISQAIDRDINAQQADIATQKDAYSAKSGIYKDMVAQFKDKRASEEATRMAYLGNAEVRVKEMMARYSGPEAKAKGMELLGEIQMKKAEARQNFMKAMAPYLQGPAGPDSNPELMTQDQRERFVPGYGLALTKEDAKELKGAVAEVSAAKQSVRELLQIAGMSGKSVSPEMRTRATSIASLLQGQLRTTVLGPGAVTESERALLEKIIANPTDIFSMDSRNKEALQTLSQKLDQGLASKVSAHGLRAPADKIGFKAVATK